MSRSGKSRRGPSPVRRQHFPLSGQHGPGNKVRDAIIRRYCQLRISPKKPIFFARKSLSESSNATFVMGGLAGHFYNEEGHPMATAPAKSGTAKKPAPTVTLKHLAANLAESHELSKK